MIFARMERREKMAQNDIVRCKDCIRLNTEVCPWDIKDYYMGKLDFCSWGEKEDSITNRQVVIRMRGDSND